MTAPLDPARAALNVRLAAAEAEENLPAIKAALRAINKHDRARDVRHRRRVERINRILAGPVGAYRPEDVHTAFVERDRMISDYPEAARLFRVPAIPRPTESNHDTARRRA